MPRAFFDRTSVIAQAAACTLALGCEPLVAQDLNDIRLPSGFRITLFADDVENARSLAMSPSGTVFVGTRTAGNVYALKDTNGDFRADKVYRIASNLTQPNGVAFHKGDLFVAERSRVIAYRGIDTRLANPPAPEVINDDFPNETHHGWKFLAVGPDDKLYVPVGAPCNVCLREDDKRFSSITRMDLNGRNLEVFAHGVRNTVGFDWHPQTRELWFTDNGRDWAGDNQPPDELNRAPKAGLHFGFPFCHGTSFVDPEFGRRTRCSGFVPPERELGPHVAALGMRFYRGEQFPAEYRNQVFIAEHGSWNRSEKIGYRVTLVRLRDGRATSYEPFATGWLDARGNVRGRPVDVLNYSDGSLLVSDDLAGKIYRISHDTN